MPRILFALLMVVTTSLPLQGLADDASHAAAARELLQLIGIDAGIGPMAKRMRDTTLAQLAAMDVPQGSEDVARPYLDKIGDIIENALSWDQLRGDFVSAYTDAFTEDELNQLIAFFKTPTGAKYLNKVSSLNKIAADIVRKNAMAAAPEIRKVTDAMRAALPAPDAASGGAPAQPAAPTGH